MNSIALRSKVMPTIRKYGYESPQMDSLNTEIMVFDSISLLTVVGILEEYGWLGKSDVGASANRAIYLTIQHAVDGQVRETYFPLLQQSAEKGESDLSAVATMQDRILVDKGEKQLYGTQSHLVNGHQELYPIAEPENLNKRRKKMKLGKLKSDL